MVFHFGKCHELHCQSHNNKLVVLYHLQRLLCPEMVTVLGGGSIVAKYIEDGSSGSCLYPQSLMTHNNIITLLLPI